MGGDGMTGDRARSTATSIIAALICAPSAPLNMGGEGGRGGGGTSAVRGATGDRLVSLFRGVPVRAENMLESQPPLPPLLPDACPSALLCVANPLTGWAID
uniref:Uncharacterized protein n=1 Tax=Hemiselmis tepida TaxID=464990 RepID=A0A7S0W0Q7_9CRYP